MGYIDWEERYIKIKNYVNNGGNIRRICYRLYISKRQFFRLVVLYNKEGHSGFIHHNSKRKPINKISNEMSEFVIKCFKEEYNMCNFSHFWEKMIHDKGLSFSKKTIRNILTDSMLISKDAHKNTIKHYRALIKAQKKPNLPVETVRVILNDPTLVDKSKQHMRLAEQERFGEEVQMDASEECWIGDQKAQLHLAVDRKQSLFLAGWIDKQETLEGYKHTAIQLFRKYGYPEKIVTDNRGVFTVLRDKNKNPEEYKNEKLTQFGFICESVGIELKTTSIAQRKGSIERANRTVQDRLTAEFKLHNVKTIEEANAILPRLLDELNKWLKKKFTKKLSSYAPIGDNNLDNLFAYRRCCTVDCGNCVRWQNKYYQAYSCETGNLINLMMGSKPLLLIRMDGIKFLQLHGQMYEAREGLSYVNGEGVRIHPSGIKNISYYKPPMEHPWKRRSFEEYLLKVKARNIVFDQEMV